MRISKVRDRENYQRIIQDSRVLFRGRQFRCKREIAHIGTTLYAYAGTASRSNEAKSLARHFSTAKAAIAALSVQNCIGGTNNSASSSSVMCSSAARNTLFAATPPPTANRR